MGRTSAESSRHRSANKVNEGTSGDDEDEDEVGVEDDDEAEAAEHDTASFASDSDDDDDDDDDEDDDDDGRGALRWAVRPRARQRRSKSNAQPNRCNTSNEAGEPVCGCQVVGVCVGVRLWMCVSGNISVWKCVCVCMQTSRRRCV